MRYYRLSEARVKRIIRHPLRAEEGVIGDAIACMQPASPPTSTRQGETRNSFGKLRGGAYSELWVMYAVKNKQIIVITAWRYPGISPERDPVPPKILQEARNIIAGI